MSNTSLIEVDQLEKIYLTDDLETHALSNVCFSIDDGEYVTFAGPSGCGKSTLLGILGLLDEPTNGRYRLAGHDASTLSYNERADIRNREIGFVFQAFNLIGGLTVFENVELPLTYRGMSRAERKDRVTACLEKVGMAHRVQHYPAQLSGGQQQRLTIARALSQDPELLMLDEFSIAVDPVTTMRIEDVLKELREEVTIILVTNLVQQARRLSDSVAFFNNSELVEVDEAEVVFGESPAQKLTFDYVRGHFG